MLAATVSNGVAEVADFGRLPLAGAPDGKVEIGIRPEQFSIGSGGELSAEGTVTLVEYLGSEIYLYVRLASGLTALVAAEPKAKHAIGDRLTLSLSPANAHYFDAAGQRLALFDTNQSAA
jgi:ABC-type sugar transport system ATPase subunit